MRLPRSILWLLWTTAAALVFTFGGSWWVCWPDWTARRFIEFVAAGRPDEANQLLVQCQFKRESGWSLMSIETFPPSRRSTFPTVDSPLPRRREEWLTLECDNASTFTLPHEVWRGWFQTDWIVMIPRTTLDTLTGARRFRTIEGRLQFTARRGMIAVQLHPDEYEDFYRRRDALLNRKHNQNVKEPHSMRAIIQRSLGKEEQFRFFGPPELTRRASEERLSSAKELAKILAAVRLAESERDRKPFRSGSSDGADP